VSRKIPTCNYLDVTKQPVRAAGVSGRGRYRFGGARSMLRHDAQSLGQLFDSQVGLDLAAGLTVQQAVDGGLRSFDLRRNARLTPAGLVFDLSQQFLVWSVHVLKSIRA
jgi:hypothetical protein